MSCHFIHKYIKFDLSFFFKVIGSNIRILVFLTYCWIFTFNNSLLLAIWVQNVKQTFWKSWTRNRMEWSDSTFDPCFKVKVCLQKGFVSSPLLVLESLKMKTAYRKSWAVNF